MCRYRNRRLLRGLATGLLAGTVVGCDVPAVIPDDAPRRAAVVDDELRDIRGIDRIRDVRARSIEVPREPRPWDLRADALEEALADGDRHATVAFKARGSARIAANTGGRAIRQAVTEEDAQAALLLLKSHDVQVLHYHALIGGAHVIFPPGVAGALRENHRIEYIEPRHVHYRPGAAPLVRPLRAWGEEPPETTPIGAQVVRADEVWSSWTGDGRSVLIIDDGYDQDHADLYSIDDSNCWNGSSSDCNTGWHGTFVAGVVAAMDNSIGVIGVASGVLEDLSWCKSGTNTEVVECLDDFAGVDEIVNMSFGAPTFSQDVADAVASAWDEGNRSLLISIANNRDSASTPTAPSNMYPAEHIEVIGVSRVMPDSSFASGPAGLCHTESPNDSIFVEWGNASNYGDYVELAAPFYTLSTAVDDSTQQTFEYGAVCGTSFAGPHVAGVAALIFDKNPSWTAGDVRQHLRSTAKDLGGAGRDDYYGYGLVDAVSALEDPSPPSVSIQGLTAIGSEDTYSWTANASGGTGSYTYTWEFREYGGSWTSVGSGQSYQRYVSESDEPFFDLRVTVTSGGEQDTDTHHVSVNIGGCNPCE